MSAPWYKANPGRYAREKAEVRDEYPELFFVEEHPVIYIRGSFPIAPAGGSALAVFEIDVEVPHRFPAELPVVRETAGRIPRTIDRHINDQEGWCCLGVEEAFRREYAEGFTLLDFLNGPVCAFFAGQRYYELTDKWPTGEWSHGPEGLFEYYEELLDTKDRAKICRYAHTLQRGQVKGHHECPCGSGEALRDCHRDQVDELRRHIPASTASRTLTRLKRHDDYVRPSSTL